VAQTPGGVPTLEQLSDGTYVLLGGCVSFGVLRAAAYSEESGRQGCRSRFGGETGVQTFELDVRVSAVMKLQVVRWVLCLLLAGGCSGGVLSGQGANEVDQRFRGSLTAMMGAETVRADGFGPVVVLVDDKEVGRVPCATSPHLATSKDGRVVFILCVDPTAGSFWLVDGQSQVFGPRDFCDSTDLSGYSSQDVRTTYLSSQANCR
jgi:hypothetical protein